jgi:hypothetical protein
MLKNLTFVCIVKMANKNLTFVRIVKMANKNLQKSDKRKILWKKSPVQ